MEITELEPPITISDDDDEDLDFPGIIAGAQ